ncbi:hypothetical protein CMK18_15220 [Candidatus Poribacteria bacterium]|nr:hypothetical protein [Candidatus Poribacteria bacterium]
MLEDLQVNIIGVLERRVEQAVELINQMKSERNSLQEEISHLQGVIQQKDNNIQELDSRNQELLQIQIDFEKLKEQQRAEKQSIEQEKSELRQRVESVISILDNLPLSSSPKLDVSQVGVHPETSPAQATVSNQISLPADKFSTPTSNQVKSPSPMPLGSIQPSSNKSPS